MSKINKSVLVINTPSSCRTCRVRYDSYGECDICAGKDLIVDSFVESNTKPDWCPLTELPQKKKGYNDIPYYKSSNDIYLDGYNDCIDEILGKKG